jgi:hypothetical protein
VSTTFHPLRPKILILIACPKRMNEFPMLCGRLKAVEIITHFYVVPCRWNEIDYNMVNMC